MKKLLFILTALLMLSSTSVNSNQSLKTEEIKFAQVVEDYTDYNQVCISGNLQYYQNNRNFLPDAFYGNYKDSGIVEIGNRLGDENLNEIPALNIRKTFGADFYATFLFTEDPYAFQNSTFIKELGYEITLLNENDEEIKESYLKETNSFSSLFSLVDNEYQTEEITAPFSSQLFLDRSNKALKLKFYNEKDYRIKSIKIIYGDDPYKIENVGLFTTGSEFPESYSLKYSFVDCKSKMFTNSIGENPTYTLYSNYGSVYSRDYLLSLFAYKTNSDTSYHYPTEIVDENGYFSNAKISNIGTEFILKIKGYYYSQVAICNLKLIIDDRKGPEIYLKQGDTLTLSYATDWSKKSTYKAYFDYMDNYDDKNNLTPSMSLENGEDIPKDIGTYKALLKVKDSKDNTSSKKITLNLIDDVAPVISCPYNQIHTTTENIYTTEKLLNYFRAYDEIDGDLDLEIESNNYSDNSRKEGTYSFTVKANDNSGNISKRTLTLYVDDETPIFYTRENLITVLYNEIPTVEEIINSLVMEESIPDLDYVSYQIIQGEEIDNNLSVGLHEFVLLLLDDEGNYHNVNLTLKVLENDNQNNNETILDMIINFFKSIIDAIISFFKN